MSEFDEETEYLDAIYNVSKGSTKKNSVGPYTKTDVAAQLGAATGIGGGAGIAFKAHDNILANKEQLRSLPKRYEAIYRPTSDPNDTFNSKTKALTTKKNVELKRLKRGLRTDIRVNSKARAVGLGVAGLGAAGMLASDVSAYKRNEGKTMKVSKGSTKNNSVGPYTKTDVAAQLGAATGIGTGVSLASTSNRKIKQQKAYKAYYDGLKNPTPGIPGVKDALSRNIRSQGKLRAVGLGVAGLGAAGMLASDASAYKRNKVSKSAYNMLPKGFSAARKAKALEMAPAKFSAKKQAAYDRMGLSPTQGYIADLAGSGVVGAGISASLPSMYRKRDKMAAARKANKVSKSAFGVDH